MQHFLWVCLGGAAGTGARYFVTTVVLAHLGAAFPYGTLTVNVAGSFLGGFMFPLAQRMDVLDPGLRLVLVTGFLGGFTTYSAFNTELIGFGLLGEVRTAAGYFIATAASCLAGGLAGAAVCRTIW